MDLDLEYNSWILPVRNRWSLFSNCSEVVSFLLFSRGNRMIDSKIMNNFQMALHLCKAGVNGLCLFLLGVDMSISISLEYTNLTFFLVELFIFSHNDCLNGGGVILRLLSHERAVLQCSLDVVGVGIYSRILS